MNIYVGNIPYAATEEDLEALFSEYGPVATATIIWDRYDKDRSKGFGFVEMENQEDGERAIEALDGTRDDGTSVESQPGPSDNQRRNTHRRDSNSKTTSPPDTTETVLLHLMSKNLGESSDSSNPLLQSIHLCSYATA